MEIDKSIIGKDSNDVMKEKSIKNIPDLCEYVDSCGGTICSGNGGCNRVMRIEDFQNNNDCICNECREK